MLNQKIQNPNPDELMIEVDLCYELDPYELKLDEMIEAEPEPEMIEGLPASDALTPADRLANAVRSRLLTPGGILASEYETGEQWDKPNGWAPLQWMAIQGFKMYGDDLLGDEIARSWLKTVNQFYLEQHKLIEKYHIADGVPREGGGGEYPLQDGFGWTNGVVRRLIGLYGEP